MTESDLARRKALTLLGLATVAFVERMM